MKKVKKKKKKREKEKKNMLEDMRILHVVPSYDGYPLTNLQRA